jgi:glycosyltransferase involved in cell wall biosynthesis
VINHEVTGLLNEEHDVAAMAVNMPQLLDDIDLTKRLVTAGSKHIRENFNLKRHIAVLQRSLEDAIAKP